MQRYLYALLTLFLLPLASFSQSVTLPAEVRAEPGVFAIVTAQTDCPSLQWVVIDAGLSLIPPELLRDSRSAVVMAAKPGTYRLLAYGAKADKASPPAVVKVIFDDPPPDPGPGPKPPPKPDPPSPISGPLWVVVIEETREAAASRGVFFTDTKLSEYMRDKKIRRRIADKDVVGPDAKVPPDLAPYLDAAKGKSLPYLMLVDETGQLRFEGALPKTPAELVELLRKAGG